MRPTIIIDSHIPFIRGVLEAAANVIYLPAGDINREVLTDNDADALIIRTRTRCNEGLLHGTGVRFIATATIGTDHIDAGYCAHAGIAIANAPGCNARSVAQYVGSALALYAHEEGESVEGKTIGIVGHGHVGSEVEKIATLLGMNILLCDPPKAAGNPDRYVPLETVAAHSDVITVHTPLTFSGQYATHRLIDSRIFSLMPHRPLIINAARGGIVDEQALLAALQRKTVSAAVIDCWEGEPHIDRILLEKALVATPHIAGYSADGKLNATCQAVDATCRFFGIEAASVAGLPPCRTVAANAALPLELLKNYPIYRDSAHLKEHPDDFEQIRNNYPARRELDITI